MSDEAFLKIFNEQKISNWSNNYLNYIMLSNKIITILENKDQYQIDEIGIEEKEEDDDEKIDNNFQNQIEINQTKLNILANNLIKEDKEKINIIENLAELDDNSVSSNSKNKISFLSEKEKKKYKKPTKQFISLLDREIKKIHIFYTNKEASLYEGINSQIRYFNNIKNKDNEENIKLKIKIISDLKYLSKLGNYLISYIYLNIRALKNILNIYDSKIMFISFKYIKKHLSKNNGDLVYILNFKILDQSLIAINDLFILVKENLKKSKILENNVQFNKDNDDIIFYINDTDKIYEKIFDELVNWERYLNMSLGFPSSSFNSPFKNTSFVDDSFLFSGSEKAKKKSEIEFEKKKSKKFELITENKDEDIKKEKENLIISTNNKKEKLINIEYENDNEDNINNNIINNKNKDNELIIKNDTNNNKEEAEKSDSKEENKYKLLETKTNKSSELFKETDLNSFNSKKILSKENLNNLKILFFLVLFYSFSISYLIPKIIIYILIKKEKNNHIYLYGVIISIVCIGNLFSKLIFKKFFNNSFKLILVLSSFFMILYYILLTIGLFSSDNYYIYIIIIGRFFLGFTILKYLSKIYVNYYVPISNQIKENQRHNYLINIGFFFGILLNSLDYLQWEEIVEFSLFNINFDFIKIIIIICLLISFVIFIIIIVYFKEPTKYLLLQQLIIDLNQRHRLSKAFLVQNKEKKNTDELEEIYSQVNEASFSGKINYLEQLIEGHINTSKYYRKIKAILFLLLISAEYTKENLLLFIPRLISYNIHHKNDNEEEYVDEYDGGNKYIIICLPIGFSFSFFFSFILQKYNLLHKKKKINNLLIILVFLFILNILFYKIIFGLKLTNNIKYDLVIFPTIGIFFMIILNEIYRAIIIKLFIKLLPSEEIILCCCQLSFAIDFITKIVKIFPALIICLSYFLEDDFKEKFLFNKDSENTCFCDYILLGVQIFLFLLCFLICIFNRSSLKFSHRNRILSLKKKKLNNNKKKLNNKK